MLVVATSLFRWGAVPRSLAGAQGLGRRGWGLGLGLGFVLRLGLTLTLTLPTDH